MNSNISTIVGFVAFLCITLTVAIHLKPQIPLTWVDDPNEFVVSFNTECLKAKNEGVPKIPMNLFNLSCIETNNFNFSTPNVVDPNDVSAKYDETAIFFTIADDSACLDNATVEHECLVYVAYSPKLFWDGSDSKAGLNFSACLSDSTTGLPDSDAINLDLLNNIRPYLTNNDKTFDYYPILDSDDPAVDIYAFERNININHIEFDEGIRDQIVLDGTASGDPSHGTQVLSVMIGANYGILRGWPGDNTNSKAYVYRGKGPGDLLAAFKTWSGSPTKYLQKTKRRAIINLSFGFWLNLDNIHHSNFKQTLSNAIDKAIQKKAILVASAGQDETRKNGSNSTAPWLPDGVNICQDTPRLLDVDGTLFRKSTIFSISFASKIIFCSITLL